MFGSELPLSLSNGPRWDPKLAREEALPGTLGKLFSSYRASPRLADEPYLRMGEPAALEFERCGTENY
jgi:hypothetical protein